MNEHTQQHLDLGKDFFAAGDYARAEPQLRAVLQVSRRFADLHHMLGVIAHQRGDRHEAIARFEEALTINPNYTDAALALAIVLNELCEYDRAREIYEKALARVSAKAVGASDPGPRAYNEIHAIDPFVRGKIANMYVQIGDVWVAQGFAERAQVEYERALAMCPDFHDIRLKLALSYRALGEHARAESTLRRIAVENPSFHRARVELGVTLHAQGRVNEALKVWDTVLAEDPANTTAKMYARLTRGEPAPPPAHVSVPSAQDL